MKKATEAADYVVAKWSEVCGFVVICTGKAEAANMFLVKTQTVAGGSSRPGTYCRILILHTRSITNIT